LSTVSKSKAPVILLFGPTGVGKTALIERLFSSGYEIINADSQQVYRFLEIGTAKPSTRTLKRIPHHLVDLLDPGMQFNVGCFVKEADRAAYNILRRERIPVISGGTAFYLRHFIYGMPPAPRADENVRDALSRTLAVKGNVGLWKELEHVDPASADKLHQNDIQRIIRALEVYYSTGKPRSSFSLQQVPRKKFHYLTLGLQRERAELYERIDRRVEEMWQAGLLDEFRRLLKMGYRADDPGMSGIGYRELFLMRDSGEYSIPCVKAEIQKNSRRYAKRQITFFKKIPGVEWFHPDQEEAIRRRIDDFLHLI